MLNKKTQILLCSLVLFFGCKKPQNAKPIPMHYEYFPVKIGAWVTYKAVSVLHTNFGSDTSIYFLKEKITEEFIDNEGNNAVRVERYWKTNLNDNFQIKDVWYANRDGLRADRVEENIRFTKMIFPISLSKKWDGNAFNTLPKWEYYYDSLHTMKVINNLIFDSTITIIQIDNINPFQRQQAFEIYAKYIGLVAKSYININNNLGDEMYLQVISYGVD